MMLFFWVFLMNFVANFTETLNEFLPFGLMMIISVLVMESPKPIPTHLLPKKVLSKQQIT